MRPALYDRVLVTGRHHAQFWSRLSNDGAVRVYELFQVLPDLGTRDGAEVRWLSPTEWDRLTSALHQQWRQTSSIRSDIEVLDIMDNSVLTRSIKRDGCSGMVGPFSLKSLIRSSRSRNCDRHYALDDEVAQLAWNSGWFDGYSRVSLDVGRCPLEGETDWWTGVTINISFTITGRRLLDSYPYSQKQSGFFDTPPWWQPVESCLPLPVTRSGRRVDAKALAEVLSAELHRRASANLAALPPMNQPWPADP